MRDLLVVVLVVTLLACWEQWSWWRFKRMLETPPEEDVK